MRAILCSALAFLFLATLTAQAGSADAIIKGETASKRTNFELHVGDLDGLVRYLKFTVDGKGYQFSEDQISDSTVIRDQKIGVYVIVMQAENRKFKIWMIPGSEKVKVNGPGKYRSTFAAKIEASDPRKPAEQSWRMTPVITIGCRIDYSI